MFNFFIPNDQSTTTKIDFNDNTIKIDPGLYNNAQLEKRGKPDNWLNNDGQYSFKPHNKHRDRAHRSNESNPRR